MAASVAPSGMPENSTVTMFPIMKAPLKDSSRVRLAVIPSSICASGSDDFRIALALAVHSDQDIFDHRSGARAVDPYKIGSIA